MSQTVCIYHGDCRDGFGAAWVVREALGPDVKFIPGYYADGGLAVRSLDGADILMVDFSYPRPVMEDLARVARSMVVLDHHVTAEIALDGLADQFPNVTTVFDMERAGVSLTWDYFFKERTPPDLIAHLEDYDLLRFALPGTREIQAAVASHPYDFDVWTGLMTQDIRALYSEGVVLRREEDRALDSLLGAGLRFMLVAGHLVPVVNLPPDLVNAAGDRLAEDHPFVVAYYDTAHGRRVSLRSSAAGEDVSKIAEEFGGGGHRHSAGFYLPYHRAHMLERLAIREARRVKALFHSAIAPAKSLAV